MTTNLSNFGLLGAGEDSAALDELMLLGPMDGYLIRSADVTFWRYRYPRHTNFVLVPTGQAFGTAPAFGGSSQITLNNSGDLVYWMYVVIELPGIHAVRESDVRGRENRGRAGRYPVTNKAAVKRADNRVYRNIGRQYTDHGDSNTEVGEAEWRQRNYGEAYSPRGGDCCSDTSSINDRCEPFVHWANAVGQLIVKRAVLIVGGHQSDTLISDYLYMWEELSGKAGKRLREMIGKRSTVEQLIRDARSRQRFYVPLPYYFTQASGNSLVTAAIRRQGVSLHFDWEELSNCIVVSDHDIVPVVSDTGKEIANSDLRAYLEATYVYLSVEERNRYALGNFDQLMTQVQYQVKSSINQSQVSIPLQFSHPCLELIWAVRRKVNEDQNQWFNYTGLAGKDPITTVVLRWENKARLSGRLAPWYRLVQPYQHHSNIPETFIYCFSFALFAEDNMPSGSANFSMFSNIELILTLQQGLDREQITALVFARNWNLMKYQESTAGPAFT